MLRSARLTLIVVLLALFGAVLSQAPPAAAHAVLLRSSPAQNARLSSSPRVVQLFFSEPIERRFSTIRIRDTSGAAVDRHDVTFTADPTEMDVSLPELAPGVYSVNWVTVSKTDGHRLTGSYPFSVLDANGALPASAPALTATSSGEPGVQPLGSLLRWLLLLGLMTLTGAFAAALLVLLPATHALAFEQRALATGIIVTLVGRVAPVAAILSVAAEVTALLRQAQQVADLSQIGTVVSGRSGLYLVLGVALAVVAGCAGYLVRRLAPGYPRYTAALLWLALTASLGTLLTMSLTSHAAARYGAGWGVPFDFVHLLAASLWLGSLAQLPMMFAICRRWDARVARTFLSTVLGRFSVLASLSVAALLITGLFSASVEVGSLRNVTGTNYGRTLLLKVLAAMPLLALGAVNAMVLAPRFQAAVARSEASDQTPVVRREATSSAGVLPLPAEIYDAAPITLQRWLVRVMVVEILAGALVLALTAVLVSLVPAGDAVAQRRARVQPSAVASSVYRNTMPAGDMQATLVVTPNRVGENEFRVSLMGPGVDAVTRVQLRFQIADQQAGASSLDTAPAGAGQYAASAANLSAVGRWQVTVNVRRTGRDDANGVFGVEVPDATGAITSSPALHGIGTFPGHGISENQTLGVVLVFAGVVLLRFRSWTKQRPSVLRLGANTVTAAAMVTGAMLFFATHAHPTSGTVAVLENPVAADQRSVDAGHDLFVANCQVCHGSGGHGDGPSAAALFPKPVDLTVHVGLHPDYQLFDWISNGISGTQMPAWKSQLTAQQRWDVVNYLRTLSPQGKVQPPPPSGAVTIALKHSLLSR